MTEQNEAQARKELQKRLENFVRPHGGGGYHMTGSELMIASLAIYHLDTGNVGAAERVLSWVRVSHP